MGLFGCARKVCGDAGMLCMYQGLVMWWYQHTVSALSCSVVVLLHCGCTAALCGGSNPTPFPTGEQGTDERGSHCTEVAIQQMIGQMQKEEKEMEISSWCRTGVNVLSTLLQLVRQ